MRVPAALAADLAMLTEALDDPAIDVAETLRRLMVDAAAAAPSVAGVSVRLHVADRVTTVTVLVDGTSPADIVTSLRVSLYSGDRQDPQLVLYAMRPGALVDMAADLAWLTNAPPTALVLDADLDGLSTLADSTGIAAMSTVNQAIGVLVAEGMTVEEANGELDARAGADHGDRTAAPARILAALDGGSATN